jgi:hypothetical protein
MKTTLRPHKVLGKTTEEGDIHALCLTEGSFAGIIFSYTDISFNEDTENDKLHIGFEYHVHSVPYEKNGYDVKAFEAELGDFVVELLYYGLEKNHLGYINDNTARENNPLQFDSQ